jgi:hypothetical protein
LQGQNLNDHQAYKHNIGRQITTFLTIDSMEKFAQAYAHGDSSKNRENMLHIIHKLRDYLNTLELHKQQVLTEHNNTQKREHEEEIEVEVVI